MCAHDGLAQWQRTSFSPLGVSSSIIVTFHSILPVYHWILFHVDLTNFISPYNCTETTQKSQLRRIKVHQETHLFLFSDRRW